MKTFLVWYERCYGEMKDDFTQQFSGENEIDVLFHLLLGWGIVRASDIPERDLKCRAFLEMTVGEDWTLEKFYKKHVELWSGQDMCFEINDIREGEIRYIYK
ncbi:MAG: hypothetical protein DCC52_10250 [Chloroflexi bacterium]|nr:MAG: hypothetical protein DCC52_10250 [Chloroflexota bacterium]